MNANTLLRITTDCTRIASLAEAGQTIDLPTLLMILFGTLGFAILLPAVIWFGVEYRFNFSELWFDIKWKLGRK